MAEPQAQGSLEPPHCPTCICDQPAPSNVAENWPQGSARPLTEVERLGRLRSKEPQYVEIEIL